MHVGTNLSIKLKLKNLLNFNRHACHRQNTLVDPPQPSKSFINISNHLTPLRHADPNHIKLPQASLIFLITFWCHYPNGGTTTYRKSDKIVITWGSLKPKLAPLRIVCSMSIDLRHVLNTDGISTIINLVGFILE